MNFDEWKARLSRLGIRRKYKSRKWSWLSMFPICAMGAGWRARQACERLERRAAKQAADPLDTLLDDIDKTLAEARAGMVHAKRYGWQTYEWAWIGVERELVGLLRRHYRRSGAQEFETWLETLQIPGADPLPLWVTEKMKSAWDACASKEARQRAGGGGAER